MMSECVALIGARVALQPMQREHLAGMIAAVDDGALWQSRLTPIATPQAMPDYIERALTGYQAGHMQPFVTTLLQSGEIVGSTRFWRIEPSNRKCEIGHTWIARSWQGSFVNPEAKYLMLRYAFEHQQRLRVQFQTDALNAQSRAALRKLGAVEEGIARNERIMPDGRVRDSVQFSIIAAEWPALRLQLEARLSALGIVPQLRIEPRSS
ncbi:GNAT family protein [Uliginosibacterium sediminicola]|uniref:GNAT family protein n=1 Tax=Uliginosibacterium sediminicola TaxID=2024550 RepID=A0ABU9YUM6_9RHOO